MASETRPGSPRMWAYAAMLLLSSSMSLRRLSILCPADLSGSRDGTCWASVGHGLSNALQGLASPQVPCPFRGRAWVRPGAPCWAPAEQGFVPGLGCSIQGWNPTDAELEPSHSHRPPSFLRDQDGYGSSWPRHQADPWHRARLSVPCLAMGWVTGQSRVPAPGRQCSWADTCAPHTPGAESLSLSPTLLQPSSSLGPLPWDPAVQGQGQAQCKGHQDRTGGRMRGRAAGRMGSGAVGRMRGRTTDRAWREKIWLWQRTSSFPETAPERQE